ncbi:MAG TPA: ATP-binding protein [Mycobacteriales bacterium]|nr:ATP-binding protein [Mycobacteriales bacterium]
MRGVRMPTVAVVAALVAATGGSAYVAHRANRVEDRRLLSERASEIALILTSDFAGLQTQVTTMAAETALNGADPRAFRTASAALAPASGGFATTTALVRVGRPGGSVRYLVKTGPLDATSAAPLADLMRRAAAAGSAGATSLVLGTGTSRVLGLAHAVGVGHLVVYEQLPLDLEAAASEASTSAPFRELDVALYAAATRDPDALILSINGPPPRGDDVATATAPFGADTWLVATRATSSLTGALAADEWWLILVTGLFLTGVLGFLVETLLRRRDYALALVAERTEELQASVRELEEAQGKLVQATRLAAIGQLASAIGHELRNPLGVITNAHYLLRTAVERPDGKADVLRHLDTAEREVGAATLIVSDLLDYARARAPVTSPVDVLDLIDEVQSVMPPPPDVHVERSDPASAPSVLADRDQLRQVLLNLLSNAYEAMPEGGRVTIAVTSDERTVSIAVTDTGIGMDEQTQAQIFEPFFTQKVRGIGLGLSVTKRIVETHRGTIRIVSALGAGTTFTVGLPAAGAEEAT